VLHENGLVRFNQAGMRRVSGNFVGVAKIVEMKMPGDLRSFLWIVKDVPQTGCGHDQLEQQDASA
jgi:hypothetical protein